MEDKTIKKLHEEKVQRWDNSSKGAELGGFCHDAVSLINSYVPKNYLKNDEYRKAEIIKNLKMLYEIKNELFAPKPLSDFEVEEGQKKYDEVSETLDIKTDQQKAEINIPIIEEK